MSDLSSASSSSSSLNLVPDGGDMPLNNRYSIATILHWVCSLLLLAIGVYLTVITFAGDITPFTLHPVMMAVAFLGIFNQAIMVFNAEQYPSINHKQRVKTHWVMQGIASICFTIGFLSVYINKNLHGKPHFMSYHGLCGLASMILLCFVCCGGGFTYYAFRLRGYVRPVLPKIFHAFGGMMFLIIGNITMVLGLYTHFFKKFGNERLIFIFSTIIVLSTILTLRHSIGTLKERILSTFVRNSL